MKKLAVLPRASVNLNMISADSLSMRFTIAVMSFWVPRSTTQGIQMSLWKLNSC